MQTRRDQPWHMSLIEAITNVSVGFIISLVATFTVLPMFGYDVGTYEGFWITCIFTGISIIRSYTLRRLFNLINNTRQ